ncbi:MAG: hypothetical protein MZU84_03790 [Sphingobacterium sp.]|nr:hypothetical protein [Sphingobacterium sp.]
MGRTRGYCLYSGSYIKPEKLAEIGYTEIDHIIPYSRSLDDSLNNKILCLSKENQQKKNDIPYEYFEKFNKNWEEFCRKR